MSFLRWLGLWLAVILLPFLLWMGLLQVLQAVLEGGVRHPGWVTIYLVSGVVFGLLALLSTVLLARTDRSPMHLANFLTVSLLASWILIKPFSLGILLFPRLLLPALAVTLVLAIAIWLFRRRRANLAA